MYFSAEEVKLIRAAAAAMPLGGARDSGKAQLSSLCDYAASSTPEALVMDIDTRERGGKISAPAAAALRSLVEGIDLCEEELRRLPEPTDVRQQASALRHKCAMAIRYVNKLRVPTPASGGHARGKTQGYGRRG